MDSIKKYQDVALRKPLIFCAVPKCGTHLLGNILFSILGDKGYHVTSNNELPPIDGSYIYSKNGFENKIYRAHFWFSHTLQEKLKNIPKIILIRDPRDYVVSQRHYLDYFQNNENLLRNYVSGLKNNYDKVSSIILGLRVNNENLHPVYEHFQNFGLKWADENSIIVRYEDLLMKKPGRVEERTIKVIESILDSVGVKYTDLENLILAGMDPTKSPTFRLGKTGKWKEEFSNFNIEQMKICAPNLVSSLGYESDEDWDLLHSMEEYPEIDKHKIVLPDHPDRILKRYENLLKISQNSPQATYLINSWAVIQLFEIGKYHDSNFILDKLLKDNANDPLWNYYKALCLHIENMDLQKSLKCYEIALQGGIDEFWVRFNRGSLLLRMNDKSLARIDLERAYSLRPSHSGLEQLVKSTFE